MTKKYFILTLLQVVIIVGGLVCLVESEHRANATLTTKNKLLRYAVFRANLDNERLTWTRQEATKYKWYWDQTRLQHREWTEVIETVYFKAQEYRIRPELVLAIIHRESNFEIKAQSYFNYSENPVAQGLMQVNTAVWKDELKIDENRIMESVYNIDLGCQILRRYLDETNGDEVRALNLYNCGYHLQNVNYIPRIKSSKFYGEIK